MCISQALKASHVRRYREGETLGILSSELKAEDYRHTQTIRLWVIEADENMLR